MSPTQRDSTRRYLSEPCVTVEGGEVRVESRLESFLKDFFAVTIVRLPLDLIWWATLFYLGFRLGARG